MASKILNVPYQSQNANPHNDKYAGSDGDSSDPTPDGCWMNAKDGSGKEFYGPGSKGCKANYDSPGRDEGNPYCVRPGSCNTTSLYMALKFFGLDVKPDGGPKGEALNSWLSSNPMSATWIYHWIMDYLGGGKNIGTKPEFSNSSQTALGENWIKFTNAVIKKVPGRVKALRYVTTQSWAEYKRIIDSNSPVLLNTGGHICLGIGYDDSNQMMVLHDPYGMSAWPNGYGGKRSFSGSKGAKVNKCGATGPEGEYGKAVRYGFPAAKSLLMYFELVPGYTPDGTPAPEPKPKEPKPKPDPYVLVSSTLKANPKLAGWAQKPETFTPPLQKKHPDKEVVKALQNALIKLGYDLGPSGADGDWGNRTQSAIVAFEQSQLSGLVQGVKGAAPRTDGAVDWTALVGLDKAVAKKEGKTPGEGGSGAASQTDNAPSKGPKPPFDGFTVQWPIDTKKYIEVIKDKAKFKKNWGIEEKNTPYEMIQRIVCGPGTGWFPRTESGDWHPWVDIGMAQSDGDIVGKAYFGWVVGGLWVRALGPGVVIAKSELATEERSYRYYVIKHVAGPVTFYALYGHLNVDMDFDVGDKVESGDNLATVGPNGAFPHLRLAIVADKQYGEDVLTPVAQSKDEAMNMDVKQANSLMAVKIGKLPPMFGPLTATENWWVYHPVHFLQWLSGQKIDTSAQNSFLSECAVKVTPTSAQGGGDISVTSPLKSDALSGNADLQKLAANKAFLELKKGWPNKEAVKALQKALATLGQPLGTSGPNKDGVDGDWGNKTTAAIQLVQERMIPSVKDKIPGFKADSAGAIGWSTLIAIDLLTKAAEVAAQSGSNAPTVQPKDPPKHTEGQLTYEQLKTIMKRTWYHETGRQDPNDERMYTTCNLNNDGCGLSYGCIQFSQKVGGLGPYLNKCKEKDQSKLREIFGSDLDALIEKLNAADQDTRMEPRCWEEPLLSKWRQVGKHKPFQEAQIALAMKNYMNPWIEKAMQYGVNTPRGLALLFDIAVQQGPGRVWQRDPNKCVLGKLGPRPEGQSVRDYIRKVPEICVSFLGNSRWKEDVRKRRQWFVDTDTFDDTATWNVEGKLGDPPQPGAEESPKNQVNNQSTGGGGSKPGGNDLAGGGDGSGGSQGDNTTAGDGTITTQANIPGTPPGQTVPQDDPTKIKMEWAILGDDGNPLKEATVELSIGGGAPLTLKTDAQGLLKLERPIADKGKSYTILVKKPATTGTTGKGNESPVIQDNPSTDPPPVNVSDELRKWYEDLEKSWNGDNHNGKPVPARVLGEIKSYRAYVPKVEFKWVKWSGQYGWMYAPSFEKHCKPNEWPLLDKAAAKLSGLDRRVAETLKYYLDVEGALASVQTYDNMTVTWGPGIAMGGAFNALWSEISKEPAIRAELMKCGFFYKNGQYPGQCHVGYVDEASGKVVFSSHLKSTEKRGPAFDLVRGYDENEKKKSSPSRPAPAILHVMAYIAKADATKQAFADAYARAQVKTYTKGDPAGVSKHWQKFKSLALMSFVCHLNHWGGFYAQGKTKKGVVDEVMATLSPPSSPSAAFDITYAKAHYKYMKDVMAPYYASKGYGDHIQSLKTDYKKFLVGLGKSVDGITFPDLTNT